MPQKYILLILVSMLALTFATPLIQNYNIDQTGIRCHEDIPGNNESAKIQNCNWAAYAAKQAKNITCNPEFASNVRKNIGGVCMAYHVPTSTCEAMLTLEVPQGVEASSLTMTFNIDDVSRTAQLIVDSCQRGGNKYLPTPNVIGKGGWYVEVTEGFASS